MTHQIGTLAGSPVLPSENGTLSVESTVMVSATAIWKSLAANLTCRVKNFENGEEALPLSPPLSPCRSLGLGTIQTDLSVACQAFATEMEALTVNISVREYKEGSAQDKGKEVPVYVMMSLDSVTMNHTVNRKKASLQVLKSAGVEGIMMDVWWGLVGKDAPGAYNWGGYSQLLEMAKKHGLKIQVVMSFH